MSIALYMDSHIPAPITKGLRRRGVDVLTAFEDRASEWDNPRLLDRASALARVLFTMDDDLLREAARRQEAHESCNGIIYLPSLALTIGQCIEELQRLAEAGEQADFKDTVWYLSA